MAGAGDVNHDGYDDVIVGAFYCSSGTGRAYVYVGSSSGLSSTAATTFTGEATNDRFGYSVAGAGDVNNDGFDDVIVGAYGYSSGVGRAYVYAGSSSGVSTAAATTLTGEATSSSFGRSVAGAGDVNNDGYDDVIVGADGYSSSTGRAYVYAGSAGGASSTAMTTLTGETTNNLFGYSVASAGDVNNDGYDDVIVGAYYYSSGVGRAYVYAGSSSGVSITAATTLTGDAAPSYFGGSVAGAGDVNNDGYDDVIVGANRYSSYTGRAYVYAGSSSGLSTTPTTTLTGGATSDRFGSSVAGAGDLNHDGYDDVMVGAYYYSSAVGRAYVFSGSASGSSPTASQTLTGESSRNYFGSSVAGAGDVNHDGYDDVIVGARVAVSFTGRAYVYTGAASGLSTVASTTLCGESASSNFGSSVAGAGDVNGDGYDDVVVGAYGYNSSTGRVYVYLGSASGVATAASTTLTGASAGINYGNSVAGAGDVNRDGYDDVIVGAPYFLSYTGRAYVYLGSGSGLSTAASTTLTEASPDTMWGRGFGYSVAGAGDVNRDGYADVIVGAPNSSSARAYVHLGSASGVVTSAATTLSGSGYFGMSVDGAGDVNADGYDDVIVGAPYYASYSGQVNVYLGSPSGVGTTAATTLAGTTSSQLGWCVAGAGDLNNDGYDDVIVGAPYYSSYTGRAYVYSGSASGISATAATTLTGTPSSDFGGAVAGAGDVNGDGYVDILVGADQVSTAYAYYGYADEDGDGIASILDCDDHDASVGAGTTRHLDADSDGYGSATTAIACPAASGYADVAGDCNDADPAINPAAAEICDAANTDENCDGLADDADPSATGQSTFYVDADSDGYGGPTPRGYCDQPSGYVATSTDCNDANAAINPAATEICDAANTDENCDGLADDADPGVSADGMTTFYADSDSDGYGGPTPGAYCDMPTGYVATSTDCNDTNPAINPSVTEICDAADTDENCNGLADDADPGVSPDGMTTFYADSDSDGFGGPTASAYCDMPTRSVATSTDCNDTDPAINPDATEICDAANTDENCNGLVDDADPGVSPDRMTTFYVDSDSDGYGGPTPGDYCDLPTGYVATPSDCNDTNPAISPAATEICDASDTDENCDGLADDADPSVSPDGMSTFYLDADSDGFGSTVGAHSCDQPAGSVSNSDDCVDTNAAINPAATEITGDGVDSTCDGAELCFVDADNDGYRPDSTSTIPSIDADCADPGEALATAHTGDCADIDSAIHPNATEIAGDGIDQDCDTTESCYVDADLDGARSESVVASPDLACTAPGEALASAALDCDDTDANAYPGATELPGDGIDESCDGAEICYVDADSDGYRPDDTSTVDSVDADCTSLGEALATALTGDCDDTDPVFNPGALEADCTDPNDYNCDGSVGYADGDSDGFAACEECNDLDGSIFPGATEIPGDLVDQDCNGVETCFVDGDDDTYRPDTTTTLESANIACDGAGEAVTTDGVDDCDDMDAAVHPDAVEIAGDEIDQDCDGTEYCYVDIDGDGYTADGGAVVSSTDLLCDGTGEAPLDAPSGDCDDGSTAYNPGADESDCTDPHDYNCDGSTGFADSDGDGFAACEECDDSHGDVNPDATEVCNGLDDDCDGGIDVGAVDAETWYADADEDGYTDPAQALTECDQPDGYAPATADDCDDGDASSYPGAEDVPGDGVDQDCDGTDATGDTGDSGDDTAGDTGDSTDDTGGTDTGGGKGKQCGCASTEGSNAVGALMLGALALAARRRKGG